MINSENGYIKDPTTGGTPVPPRLDASGNNVGRLDASGNKVDVGRFEAPGAGQRAPRLDASGNNIAPQ